MPLDSNSTGADEPRLLTTSPDDVVEYARLFVGWTLRIHQLSVGAFRSDLTELNLDHIQLIRERTTQALWKEGQINRQAIVLCVPLRMAGPAHLNGHLISFPDPVLFDGTDLPPVLTPPGLDVVSLAFDRQWLLESLERLGERHAADILVHGKPHHCLDRANSWAVRQLIVDLFESCERVGRALQFTEARRALQDDLVLALLQIVASSVHRSLGVATPQKRVADRARELLLARVDEPPSIADLCDHLSVSRRNLQACFQSAFGMAPANFLRVARLNAVRQELLAVSSTGSQTSIGDVAARWGFWHWSRFAAHYRTMFGELPSDTCRRELTGS